MTTTGVTPSLSGYPPGIIPEIKFVAAAGQENTIVKTSVGVSVSKTERFFYSGGWDRDRMCVILNFFSDDKSRGYSGTRLAGDMIYGTSGPGDCSFVLYSD
jgi:hypothetical protein